MSIEAMTHINRDESPCLPRALGLDTWVVAPIYTEEELREAETMTFEEHAREVLKEKTVS